MKRIFFLICCLMFTVLRAQTTKLSLIPLPQTVNTNKGTFSLKNNQRIAYNDASLEPAARYLQELLAHPTGYSFTLSKGQGAITLRLDTASSLKNSAYRLSVDKGGVMITAGDYRGIVCGIATLRQLLPKEIESKSVVKGKWNIPCVNITDAPASEWRGLHLDVSRHFFNVKEVKDLLDLMALYKLDKFHWHLTDDQGWRIEIKHYPLLTEKGGWRKLNNQDQICLNRAKNEHNADFNLPKEKMRVEGGDTLYGGFYTQDEIRDVVKYAQVRGIDVIPEIDMPGHILCALENYQGISCFPTTGWGQVFSSPICPGKESALEFCRNVFAEVISLFPYEYVHIGGDEVEKGNWKKCPDCQARIHALGLKNEEELQSWFIKYMEMFFNSHNRRLLGWDEITEGGLSKSATITWWRGWAPDAVKHALEQGNNVVLCPTSYCYFDYQPDNSTLETLYKGVLYDKPITDAQQSLIKGLQANIWTEWIPTVARMQYMVFPRALAIAEKGWTAQGQQDWNSFNNRLQGQIDRLYSMGINYHPQELDKFIPVNVFIDKQTVRLNSADRYTQVRYTTDETIPTMNSALYTKPITIDKTTTFKIRLFSTKGKPGSIYTIKYIKQSYSPAAEVSGAQQGLTVEWYDYAGEKCSEITTAKLNGTFVQDKVAIPAEAKGNIGLVIKGYIDVPQDGVYTFALLSDDGSTLIIDNNLVIDNDGPHSPKEVKGQMALRKGLHPITVRYFDHNGGTLKMNVADTMGQPISVSYLH